MLRKIVGKRVMQSPKMRRQMMLRIVKERRAEMDRVSAELLNANTFTVVLCGTGTPIPSDRAQTSVAVFANGQFLLFDAGHGALGSIQQHNLPIVRCGCGRLGCAETYVAGPGLSRLAKCLTGSDVTPPEIAQRRDSDMAETWALWCDLTADLLRNMTLTVDPDIIVLGGGLRK